MNTQPLMKGFLRFDWLPRLFCVLFIAASLAGPLSAKPLIVSASPSADKTFVVDATYDEVSSGAANGICTTPVGGGCTLREAIKEANANSTGNTTITFALYSNASLNLTLGALLAVGNHITIDGTGASFYINGAGNPADTDVFSVQGNDNTLQLLTIRNSRRDGIFVGYIGIDGYGNNNRINNVIVAGSVRNGVYIHQSSGNWVSGSLIGSTAWINNLCATGQGNGADGIVVDGNSQDARLSNNRIVCNGASGVYISQSNATQLWDNIIGTDGTSYALGNGYTGVKDYLSTNTLLNGNLISRNGWEGVWLQGSTGATLVHNKIGTAASGNTTMGNLYDGVNLSDNANNNTIGSSSDANLRNVISGNSLSGIALNSGAHDNLIDGNAIGIGNDGVTAVPNEYAGVAIVGGSNNNNIGAPDGSTLQLVASNLREGIYIESANSNHIHTSNHVGLAGTGSTPRGNGREGILIVNAANNLIEGHYAYNGLAGIAIVGDTATSNLAVPTYIYSNGGLPVDLGNDGATLNGSHGTTGPNHWLPYPVITGVSGSSVSGTTCNNCYIFIYQAIRNPATNRGGGELLSMTTANASGAWTYTLPSGKKRNDLSLIACTGGLAGDCSEMSPRPVVYIPLATK
jgi:CSLREA domain-containing protein